MKRRTMAQQGGRFPTQPNGNRRDTLVPGSLVIQWASEPRAPRVRGLAARAPSVQQMERIEERLRYLRANHGLHDIVPVFGERRAARRRLSFAGDAPAAIVSRSLLDADDDEASGLTILRVDPKSDLKKLTRHLAGSVVKFAEPSPRRWLAAQEPLDPRISTQWGLSAIDWFGAKRPDASKTGVAVIDSGIDMQHPDLKGAIASYEYGTLGSADAAGHGTHVAGIIAAVTNNRIGIAGVSNAQLHCWKIFGGRRGEDYDDVAYFRALGAVANNKTIKVVNLSLGGVESSKAEQSLMTRLLNRGVLIVAAMGNEFEDDNPTEYPAAYKGVMAIGAVGPARTRAPFSNTGTHISIVAPGESILSTLPRKSAPGRPEKNYAAWDGTSMATPFVAGAAALVFARFPNYSPIQVRRRLETRCERVTAMKGKRRTSEYGYGLLQLKSALATPTKKRR